ncbi:sporulation protein [Diplocarpon rosae]|nr:sporulation protein [Diplocarpon rosae]
MFSRIYQSARALLINPTQNENSKTTPKQSKKMVTSRSQSRSHSRKASIAQELNDDNTIKIKISSSTKKRSKPAKDEAEETTPSAKKRKTLPVREKDAGAPMLAKTRPVVEITARNITPQPDTLPGSATKPIEIEDDEESVDNEENEDEEDSEDVGDEMAQKGREETAQKPADEVVGKIDTTKQHKRFDSEESAPELEFFSAPTGVPEDAPDTEYDSQDSGDSEDDAPEAIGIQEAAEIIKSKERSTAKAVKEKILANRKKRKERDEILKKQSETAKKRKLENVFCPLPKVISPGDEQEEGSMEPRLAFNDTRSLLTCRAALPNFLPAEYLDDTDSQAVLINTGKSERPKPKKTKFLDATSKQPKDRRIGSTTYRVAKPGRTNLAPKSSFQARSIKESWLQGRSGKKIEATRRPFGKAFGRG